MMQFLIAAPSSSSGKTTVACAVLAALKKRGEKVSGDRGSYFKTDSGVLCVILSDGMGTGSEAAKESAEIVGILEKFLRSGADPAVAMKLLNSVMLLRGGDDSWGYATVDLMCVDLFSGETCFYKYGAAPSYVMNSGRIRRIKGETLAAGLNLGDGECVGSGVACGERDHARHACRLEHLSDSGGLERRYFIGKTVFHIFSTSFPETDYKYI